MAIRGLVAAPPAERTVLIVRAVLACALVAHVALDRVALQDAGQLALATNAVIAFVALSLLVTWSPPRLDDDRPVAWVSLTWGAVDALLLVPIVYACTVASGGYSAAWVFLLWLPWSMSKSMGHRSATAVAVATSVLVYVTLTLALGASSGGTVAESSWSIVGLPTLLSLLFGAVAVTAAAGHRSSADAATQVLDIERDRVLELEEQDRLKDTYLMAVNHELRTPLTSILGFAITLLDRQDLPVRERDHMLHTLVEEAEHLEEILTNMLDLDRATQGREELLRTQVDVGELVRRAATQLERRTGRTVQVDAREPLLARLDVAKVDRIVQNLLANAAKYTPTDSPISIEARIEDSVVKVQVDDCGPGIPEEEHESIFEPFRRGSRSEVAPGTGLGLSIVSCFCRMHQGRAWVEESSCGGCSFRIELPSIPEVAPAVASDMLSGDSTVLAGAPDAAEVSESVPWGDTAPST